MPKVVPLRPKPVLHSVTGHPHPDAREMRQIREASLKQQLRVNALVVATNPALKWYQLAFNHSRVYRLVAVQDRLALNGAVLSWAKDATGRELLVPLALLRRPRCRPLAALCHVAFDSPF